MIGHTVMPCRGGRDGPPSRGKEDSLGGALAIEAQRQLVQIADRCPWRPDSGVEVDPSDQAVSPILVHRAQPRVDKSGATPVDHQGIIPRASSYALICSQAEAVTARLG